jgi:putative endonuclease
MAATYAHRKALGDYGERLAVRELQRLGLAVLDRNWRCGQGEIDIVAEHGDELVVCEVKTRTSDRYGSAVQAITEQKAARLHRLGLSWARDHQRTCDRLRVDVVTVLLAPRTPACVTHYPGLA